MVSAPSLPIDLAPDAAPRDATPRDGGPRDGGPRDAGEVAGVCAMCPHPVAVHDPISLRFCRATQASALTRGCVCPSA
jgi:hypothetical protein